MRKNISQLRDVLQRGGEFLKQSLDSVKQAIDCGVTAACLLLEDHQAGDQAKASARIVTEIAPAPILSGKKELSTQELADRWGGSTRSIYEWKKNGRTAFQEKRPATALRSNQGRSMEKGRQELFTRAKFRVVK